MFCLIYDKEQGRVIHYASDPDEDIMNFFNTNCHREFFTNHDYVHVGGRKEDFPLVASDVEDKEMAENNSFDNLETSLAQDKFNL